MEYFLFPQYVLGRQPLESSAAKNCLSSAMHYKHQAFPAFKIS